MLAYHEATKHHLQRFAAGPHDLDWANQPDPFRRFPGAPLLALEHVAPADEPPYEPSFHAGEIAPRPLSWATLSQLLFDSLSLSAWKQLGPSRWSLRVNPSSGNLHPTEAYVACGALPPLAARPFLAHYAPREHALELRSELTAQAWERLASRLPCGALLVGLTSIHWREAWKYGERAFRYCQHDLGHAIGAITVAAAALGWRARLLEGPSSAALARFLGVDAQAGPEAEHAECLLALFPQDAAPGKFELGDAELVAAAAGPWLGRANELSPEHVAWSAIDAAEEATLKPETPGAFGEERSGSWQVPAWPREAIGREPIPLRRIVRQRRSAVALDGKSGLARDAFFQALARTLPGPGRLALEVWPWRPRVDLLLFVHRVADLEPGLYMCVRSPDRAAGLRHELRSDLAWEPVRGAPQALGLFARRAGDVRAVARGVACHQEIAADGCFAVGMRAELEPALRERGPWFYRRLFWECGLIGQLLYLEAEALSLSATGIGCFFDDPVHALLGLRGRRFQDLYHFTLGGAVADARLTTLPAYPAPEEDPA